MASHPRPRPAKEILEELKRLQAADPDDRTRLSMRHEISVYQEELLVQNEALLEMQVALEATRDRFIELYDFAPSGYVILDDHGVIRQCNLTAAALIGKSKTAIEGLPFLGLVGQPHRAAYLAFLRRCRRNEQDSETELTLQTANGPRQVQLLCRHRRDRDGKREFLAGIVDVTERRHVEREREQITRERASLTSRLIASQEDERLRIARNLHDDVGQQVTALRLKLEELATGVPRAAIGPAVERVQEMLQQLDRRLHYVASELRPAALDLGIVAAMEQFVREWSATFGVPAFFHSAGINVGSLSQHVETNLYRIAQEALNNMAKHAKARQITVLLEQRARDIVLLIEDDGCGFDLETVRSRGECLGLVGMRERAQILGGQFKVDTSPGNGTSILVLIPPESRA